MYMWGFVDGFACICAMRSFCSSAVSIKQKRSPRDNRIAIVFLITDPNHATRRFDCRLDPIYF